MKFRLGLVQMAPTPGDVEANLSLMDEMVQRAGTTGEQVDLLVFPELCVTGYSPAYWKRRPTRQDEQAWQSRVHELAKREGIWIIYGHPSYCMAVNASAKSELARSLHGDDAHLPLYNAVSLISPHGLVGTYAKVHLFGNEPATFARGDAFPVWETPWGKVAIQICYDLEFPEGARVAALHGADMLIYPANNMAPFGEYHRIYTMARAMENAMFVATVNRTGVEGNLQFCGGSCVAHPEGRWLIEAGPAPGLYTCDIHMDDLKCLDESLGYFRHRQPQLYEPLVAKSGGHPAGRGSI
ncbi:carbon-nitrogen hydrolase family protein [Alicyclobacillus pomorum]|uniref:carbon-nitrogen hydrolase family protein n=1 Tax=Alicyclobacillus pomorum TaxID=204470 RepID=UPI00146FBB56|nr:carbon-nitrogen hydrolase family protein [Alicyclobacillus pomorum]